MNGIEKITERIAAEANAECMGVAAEAEKRAAAVRAEYEEKARSAYDDALLKGKAEADEAAQRVDRNVRLEARKDVLALKQEIVDTAFRLARQKVLDLPRDRYAAFLARLAAEAAQGDEEVVLSPEDAASVGPAVVAAANQALAERGARGGLTLCAQTRPIAGGLVLRKGDIEVNCTVDTLLELSRGELAAQVAGILFE